MDINLNLYPRRDFSIFQTALIDLTPTLAALHHNHTGINVTGQILLMNNK